MLFLFVALVVFSCNSADSNKKNNTAAAEAIENTAAPEDKDSEEDETKLSFRLNDTLVRTNKTKGGDTDEHIGIYTQGSQTLSLDLYGDVPERPHRGLLKFNIKDFKFEPGTYSLSNNHTASMSRYATVNGGGETMFTANTHPVNKGTDMTITFTKLEKVQGDSGVEYLADGSFSATLYNQIFVATRTEPPTIVRITEGKFERLRIVGGLGTTLQ